jgi:hypothetical protein
MILQHGTGHLWCPACGDIRFSAPRTAPGPADEVRCLGCRKKFTYQALVDYADKAHQRLENNGANNNKHD